MLPHIAPLGDCYTMQLHAVEGGCNRITNIRMFPENAKGGAKKVSVHFYSPNAVISPLLVYSLPGVGVVFF